MKRKLFITAALATIALAEAHAQHTSRHNPFSAKHQLDVTTQGILQRQQPAPAQRGTAVADRLIGWMNRNDDGNDSASYKYNTSSRGSSLDNNVLNTYFEYGYNPGYEQAQPYPIAVARSRVSSKYDTAYYQMDDAGTITSKTYVSRSYTGNTPTTQYYYTDQINGGAHDLYSMRTDFTYDAGGNLTTTRMYQDTSVALNGRFAPSAFFFYTYGNAGVAKDSSLDYSTGTPTPYYKVIYTYDGAGNLTLVQRDLFDGSAYQKNKQDIYTYVNSKLQTHLSQYYNNANSWDNDETDTFKYTGNNVTYSSWYYWDENISAWSDGEVTRSYYDAQNNLDSQYISSRQGTSALAPDYKLQYTYNVFGHFNTIKGYYYNAGNYNTTPDIDATFYYQTFTPTAINTPVSSSNSISLYPIPATDVLNIRYKESPRGNINVRIYNAMGQLVLQTSMGAASTTQVPVSDLASGNYTAEVSDGETSKSLPFVKH